MYFEIGAPVFEASTVTVAETAGRTNKRRQARDFMISILTWAKMDNTAEI